MTDRFGTSPHGTYYQGEARAVPEEPDEGLSTKKTMLVLVIVVGCFAVLWPKLFYPMLVSNANSHIQPGPIDQTTGCCDVISELDVDTIKIMSELCGTILEHQGKTPPAPQNMVAQCRKAVLETCGIDISAALQDRISLGHSAKQILEEVRSLNGSLCFKYNFGVSPWTLGVPHRVSINLDPVNSIRQERPSHMRPGMVHPAFRERGRAIPEADGSETVRKTSPAPRIVEGRPGPIPGMRPVMGGPGHVVTPPKQSNYGFMGVLMPIYTVGFVIFFSYTVMKVMFKKKSEAYVGSPLYPQCDNDEQFHKAVFEPNKHYFNRPNRDTSKIVVNAVAALLEEVNQEIETHKTKTSPPSDASGPHQDEIKANGDLPKEEEQGSVTVMAMETTASCEGGKKWSRPDSPVLPHRPPKEPSPPPQQIFLEGALPPQSQILVADSATETQKDPEDDSPVVLAGKMTLSVISLDSEPGAEDSSESGKKSSPASDEERGRSSSNTSEEFEKINAADLEDQIDNIIEEAEGVALAEKNRLSPKDELEIPPKAPQINEKDQENDILEEIKNQFNLEDDLLQALKGGEPVTDIIKELLNKETDKGIIVESLENTLEDVEAKAQEVSEDLEALKEGLQALKENLDAVQENEPSGEDQIESEGNATKNMADVLLQGLLPKVDQAEDTESKNEEETKEEAQHPPNPLDVEDLIVEDIAYEDVSEEDRESVERRLNGEDSSRNGADNSETAAENEISEDELVNDDDDEEIEEIIEYVDNTDDEGEEIIEINGNEHIHPDEDGTN